MPCPPAAFHAISVWNFVAAVQSWVISLAATRTPRPGVRMRASYWPVSHACEKLVSMLVALDVSIRAFFGRDAERMPVRRGRGRGRSKGAFAMGLRAGYLGPTQ